MSDDRTNGAGDIPELPRPWGQPPNTDEEDNAGWSGVPSGDPIKPTTPGDGGAAVEPPPSGAGPVAGGLGGPTASSGGPGSSAPNAAGCGKPAAIGCGCVGLALGLFLVLAVAMSGRIVTWFLDTSEEAIFEALPETVQEQQRTELRAAFAGFKAGLANGELRTQGVTQLQLELTNAYSRSQNGLLEPVDIERLLNAFRRVLPLEGVSPSRSEPKQEGTRSLPVALLSWPEFSAVIE